jgi:GT2 family glycosyltransferase
MRSMTADLLGIVVVNYGSSQLLEDNLARLTTQGRPFRVVVVDNFSSATERAATARLASAHGWHLVALPDNRGFAAGVNAGVRAAFAAGCSCYLLLNPDASVTLDVVAELRRQVLADPAALVSPRILAPDGQVFFDGARLHLDTGRIRGRASATPVSEPAVDWVSGACLAFHDDLLRRVGDLDESYFLYWEDVDFSMRALAAGATLVVRHDLVALHDAGGTQGPTRGRAKSALYYRYNCMNRLRFAARHLPRRRLVGWMLATPAVGWEILRRGGRRQLVRQHVLLLAALRGSLAGMGMAAAALVRRPVPAADAPVRQTVSSIAAGGGR